MPLDSEKTSCEKDKNNEEELIASLLSLNQSGVPIVCVSTPMDLNRQEFCKIKSERWRDSICTAVRKTDTEVSTSPDLWIFIDDLLTDREKEQERLRKIISKDYKYRGVPETFECYSQRVQELIQELIQERNYEISTESPRRSKQSHPMVSEESQANEGNLDDSNRSEALLSKEFDSETADANLDISEQTEPAISKESTSQITVDSLDTLKQSVPVVSKESAAQTIETNLDVAQQTEPVISKESASQTTVGSLDISKTSGLSSEVSKPTDPTKEVRSDDHVFALPAVPSQRSSSRLMKTRKDSKSEDLSEKSVTTLEAGIRTSGRKSSRDTPDPRRRSSRLSSRSSRSCSEVDEDSESSEEKSKVTFTTKSKQKKKLESSGGESDEGRSTPATRASRRLKK